MSAQVRACDLTPRQIANLRIETEIAEGKILPSDCDIRLTDGSFTRVYLVEGDPENMMAKVNGAWGRLKNPVLILRPGERQPEPMPENKPRTLAELKAMNEQSFRETLANQQASRQEVMNAPIQETPLQRAARKHREQMSREREDRYNNRGYRPPQ